MSSMMLTPFNSDLCNRLDQELERADLSVHTLHQVLDRIGAPGGNGEPGRSVAQRLSRAMTATENSGSGCVQIGCNYMTQPKWKIILGVPLIYLPLLVGVFPMIVTALLTRTHLRLVGGHQLKSYWNDFAPNWTSHRYTRNAQIRAVGVLERYPILGRIARSRLFWIFNCKLYCPLTVALIGYLHYLVKVVEQWWCPFGHDRKCNYADAPIDQSFWHATGDQALLHPEDRSNPGWNGGGS